MSISATPISGQPWCSRAAISDGDVILAHGRLDRFFALDGSAVSGVIDATAIISDSDVSFADGRTIGHIDGAVGGVEAQKTVSLRDARIHDSLYLNGGRFHQIVDLRAAHIDGEAAYPT